MSVRVGTRWMSISRLIVILCIGCYNGNVFAVNPYSNVFRRRRLSSSSAAAAAAAASTYRFIPDKPERSVRRNPSIEEYNDDHYDNYDDDDDDDLSNDEEEKRLGMEIKRQLEQAMERNLGVRPWSIEVNSKRANEYSWTTRLVTMNVLFHSSTHEYLFSTKHWT